MYFSYTNVVYSYNLGTIIFYYIFICTHSFFGIHDLLINCYNFFQSFNNDLFRIIGVLLISLQ